MGIGKFRFFLLILLGTKPLRQYSYSIVGTPSVLEYKQLLSHNLTATTTISMKGVEFLQYTFCGGTKNEHFV